MSDTDSVFDNWKKLRREISEQRLPNAMTELTIAIESEAIMRAPVDTTTLVNSAYHDKTKKTNGWEGEVGFTVKYAYAVHEMKGTLEGKPREHFGRTSNRSEFGPVISYEFGGGSGKGNYWDGYGDEVGPKFLEKSADYIVESGMAQKILEDNLE